jgi:uncharacterized protein (TIGR03032 family)
MAERPRGRLIGSAGELNQMWARHHAEWRAPAQIASQWKEAMDVDPRLLAYQTSGAWWEILAEARVTLVVTREYEHLVMALRADQHGPELSYLCVPHPSGLAVDRRRGVAYLASTRNPNQIYDLAPVTEPTLCAEKVRRPMEERPLIPISSRVLPGCLYLHDLALIGGRLHANAVGQNAIVRLLPQGRYKRVWWPHCIETPTGPIFERNHLQLNSIAAGSDLGSSYFTASTDRVSARRPGHRNFPVDRRGVIFGGTTREPVARGLTRPHSARLRHGRLWVDNSGYGEFGFVANGQFQPIARLPGWTRGLCFIDGVAIVGTSRIIPRFRHYAPGLAAEQSRCGLHAVHVRSGRLLGSLEWPYGNQIFAIDWAPEGLTTGFPFCVGTRHSTNRNKVLFYAFSTLPPRRQTRSA